MEENGTINTMYNRFDDIVVGLKGLEKAIGKVELNHKLFYLFQRNEGPR